MQNLLIELNIFDNYSTYNKINEFTKSENNYTSNTAKNILNEIKNKTKIHFDHDLKILNLTPITPDTKISIEQISTFLRNESPIPREAAMNTFYSINDKKAIPIIAKHIKEENKLIVIAAGIRALNNIAGISLDLLDLEQFILWWNKNSKNYDTN